MARCFVQLSLDERRIIARMHEKKITLADRRRLHHLVKVEKVAPSFLAAISEFAK